MEPRLTQEQHTDPDHPLADRQPDLRTSAEARIRQQITQAAARRQRQTVDRATRQATRTAGLRARHATREARHNLIAHHQQKENP